MKISMLMPTLNRRKQMITAIDSILTQGYQNFEIIVVDQSDHDNSDIKEWDQRINYIHLDIKGLSHARNVGLNYVTGDIIGLMDDDAVYERDALEKVNKMFSTSTDLGLLAGMVIDPETNQISLRGMKKRRMAVTKTNIFKCCISPSMFFKSDLLAADKFDERFGIGCYWGSAEETDVALKVIYKNLVAIYDPEILVKHPGSSKKDLPLKKLESYSRGYGAVCAKHSLQYHNTTMRYLYFRALFRSMGGLMISMLCLDKHMIDYYKISIRGKIEGYHSYRMEETKK